MNAAPPFVKSRWLTRINVLGRSTGREGYPIVLRQLVFGVLLLVTVTSVAYFWEQDLGIPGVVILYFLAVVLVSYWSGLFLSVSSSMVAVGLMNYLFVDPRHTFFVGSAESWVTLVGLLTVSLVVSSLAHSLQESRFLAENERHRSEFARETLELLIGLESRQEILSLGCNRISAYVKRSAMLVSRSAEGFKTARVAGEEFVYDPSVLRWIHRRGIAAGPFTDQFASLSYWIFPLEPQYEEGVLLIVDAQETRAAAAESDGREQYDDLKVIVQQLTLALQNERARRGESDALKERDDETLRNRLLASVAHDMRTPLATIMTAAASIESSLDEGDLRKRHLVATIADEAGQMSKVTSNILAMVRLQWGEQALSADWESVEELVGAVVNRHANRSTTQAKVITKVDHNLPLIWIDGPLISQVIDNLVINACRYAPSTGLIEIHAHQASDLMIFEVIDYGPGFSPAVIAAFDSLDGSMPVVDSDPLLGLGLSICKAIARVHGGTLSLMNRQDGSSGALVRMCLPMRTLKSLHQLG